MLKENLFTDSFVQELVEDLKDQQNEIISKMLNDAIKKGILIVRKSDPVLTVEWGIVKLKQSAVIDYLGDEKIEELEKSISYLKTINSNLHTALSEFYEKSKENQWLKSP